jgi:beta-galactosidase
VVCSNCDHLKFYLRVQSLESNPWQLLAEIDPDRSEFANLTYAPFLLDLSKVDIKQFSFPWGDLRIDGYLKGQKVISKSLSGRGVDTRFALLPDDTTLMADGADTTRVVLRVTDEFGAMRTYADDPVEFALEGPADLIGDNPFSLVGGTGAVWVRARQQTGKVTLTAKHPRLGTQQVVFNLTQTQEEPV